MKTSIISICLIWILLRLKSSCNAQIYGLRTNEIVDPPSSSNPTKIEVEYWKSVIKNAEQIRRDHTVNYGIKTKPVFCPLNMYVWGYRIFFEANVVYTPAIAQIELLCRNLETSEFYPSETVTILAPFNVSHPKFDMIQELFFCEAHNGPLTQIHMAHHGWRHNNIPDEGIINLQGICWDGRVLPEPVRYLRYNRNILGNASGSCEDGKAICGFSVTYQLESPPGTIPAAIKNVVDLDPYCCAITDGMEYCYLNQQYKIVGRIDNRGSNKPTTEKIVISQSLRKSNTTRISRENSWKRTRSESLSNSIVVTKMKEMSRSDTNRKFDRELSLSGALQGIGDMVTGFTGFISNGIGRLLGKLGLGSLFQVSNLPKLIGTIGKENLIKMGNTGLEKYFEDSPFKSVLESGLSDVFYNLETINAGHKLQNMWGYQGYASTIHHFGKIVSDWRPIEHPDVLEKFVGVSSTHFSRMSLRNMMGLYGFIIMHGKQAVQEMLGNGTLQEVFDIGTVGENPWEEGLGQFESSCNLAKMYNCYGLASVFGIDGLGRKLDLTNLTKVPKNIVELTDSALDDLEKHGLDKNNELHWLQAVFMYLIHEILGNEHQKFLQNVYESTSLGDFMGPKGLQEGLLKSEPLIAWFKATKDVISDSKAFPGLLKVSGLQKTVPGFGSVIGHPRFRKVVGTPNFEKLVGSRLYSEAEDLQIVGALYGLRKIFGDNATLPKFPGSDLKNRDLHEILSNHKFGTMIGLYTLGQILNLESLNKITGSVPPKLSSLDNLDSIKGRGIISDIGGALMSGLQNFLGGSGLINRIIGSDEGSQVRNEITDSERLSLEESIQKTKEDMVEESHTIQNSISNEVSRIESENTQEIIDNTFAAKTLTLILAPTIHCDEFFSVDILDKKSFMTILIPESGSCIPQENYIVVAEFDSLNFEKKDNRTFNMEVGSELEFIKQWAETSNVKQLINSVDPTRGVREAIRAASETTQGLKNVQLKRIIDQDLTKIQVWEEPIEFEGEVEIWKYNYNIVLQLVIKCGSVITKSASPILIRLPKVFHCDPTGEWRPLTIQSYEKPWFNATIGLIKAGKDANQLNQMQKLIPIVQTQLSRMANELHELFSSKDTAPTNLDDVNWTEDSSLKANSAWSKSIEIKQEIQNPIMDTFGTVYYQLIAKCGPIELALEKFQIKRGNELVAMIPPNSIDEDAVGEDEECPPHIEC